MPRCPLGILSFFPFASLSLPLSIPAGPCVLHLSAGLGRRLDREDAGRYWDVKVTRAGCHPSLRFPLSSSIIDPLNQTPLHTGETFPSVRVCEMARSRLLLSVRYLLLHRPAESSALWDTRCVCYIGDHKRCCVVYWLVRSLSTSTGMVMVKRRLQPARV